MDIDFYLNKLNLQNATFLRIDHEEALVAIVYKVIAADGNSFILKISPRPNDYFREIHFLKLLSGIVPVPKMIGGVDPEKNCHGAILMEYLSGSLLNHNALDDALAYTLGQTLALIHQNRLGGYGDPLSPALQSDPIVYFTEKFEEGIDECQNHLAKELLEKCRKYYDANLSSLHAVDGPCVVHRDFRPGNLMVHLGQLQGVIDWAGARYSFAEEDFSSIEHGNWLNGTHKISFFSGYKNVRRIPKYERLIPFLRLNKAIATLGFLIKNDIGKDSNLYRYNLKFIETL